MATVYKKEDTVIEDEFYQAQRDRNFDDLKHILTGYVFEDLEKELNTVIAELPERLQLDDPLHGNLIEDLKAISTDLLCLYSFMEDSRYYDLRLIGTRKE